MRSRICAIAIAALPCAALAQDHAFSTGFPSISSITKLNYNSASLNFTPGGMGAWTPVYTDSTGDGGLGNVRGGPLPAPGPPPAPIAPPIIAFDALHAIGGAGFTARGLRVNYYQYAHTGGQGNTSLKIRLYANNANDSLLPSDIGGNSQSIAELTVPNLPDVEGAYELEIYNFAINMPSEHLWVGIEFTDGFAIPMLGSNGPNSVGDSANTIGWNNNIPGFGPGIYDLDNGTTWADFGLGVAIPAPAATAAIGIAGLSLARRRR